MVYRVMVYRPKMSDGFGFSRSAGTLSQSLARQYLRAKTQGILDVPFSRTKRCVGGRRMHSILIVVNWRCA